MMNAERIFCSLMGEKNRECIEIDNLLGQATVRKLIEDKTLQHGKHYTVEELTKIAGVLAIFCTQNKKYQFLAFASANEWAARCI